MSHLPLPEFYRRVALDAVAANDKPAQIAFLIQIKRGRDVVMEFGAVGPDSITVAHQHQSLCAPGQYIRCVPASRKEEPFPLAVARHAVATAELREVADAYLTETEAGAFAIVPAAQLSEAEAAEVDRQYGRLKDSGELRRRDDRHALDDQIQMQGCIGWLPA